MGEFMSSQRLKAIVASCGLCISGLATAQVTFSGFANGSQAVRIDVTPNSPAENLTIGAGGFLTSYGSQSFVSYCVDLYQYLPTFGIPGASYSEANVANFFGTAAKLDAVGRLFSGFAGGVTSSLSSAAFQLALWEITNESEPGSGYNLSSGNARFIDRASFDGNSVDIAQGYLNRLGDFSNNVQLHVLSSGSHQDVVYATAVPEPSTYALMIAGLIGVGAVARRRQNKR